MSQTLIFSQNASQSGDDYTKLTSITWSMGLLQRLCEMRMEHDMCDVKMLLEGGVFIPAHSCVLAGASPFMKSLLSNGETKEIHLENFPASIVQQVVEFIYTGNVLVKECELLIFQSVAATLNVPVLTEMATKIMQNNLGNAYGGDADRKVDPDVHSENLIVVTPEKHAPVPNAEGLPVPVAMVKSQSDKEYTGMQRTSTKCDDVPLSKKSPYVLLDKMSGDVEMALNDDEVPDTRRRSLRTRKPTREYEDEITVTQKRKKCADAATPTLGRTRGKTAKLNMEKDTPVSKLRESKRGKKPTTPESEISKEILVSKQGEGTIASKRENEKNLKRGKTKETMKKQIRDQETSKRGKVVQEPQNSEQEKNEKSKGTPSTKQAKTKTATTSKQEQVEETGSSELGYQAKTYSKHTASDSHADKLVSSVRIPDIKEEIDDSAENIPQNESANEAQETDFEENRTRPNMLNSSEENEDGAVSQEPADERLEEAVDDEEGFEDDVDDFAHDQDDMENEQADSLNSDEQTVETNSDNVESRTPDVEDIIPAEEQDTPETSLPNPIEVLQKRGDTYYMETVIPMIESYTEHEEAEVDVSPEGLEGDVAGATPPKKAPPKVYNYKRAGISAVRCNQVPVHSGPTFMCSVCNRCFTDQVTYEYHVKKHEGVQPGADPLRRFRCRFCEYRSRYKHTLNEHENTHTGNKPFKCSFCDKCFAQRKGLTVHEDIHKNIKFPCQQCDKIFSSRINRTKHLRAIHNPDFRPYKCPFCSQCFKVSSVLRKHLKIHTKLRPYQCHQCSRAYFDRVDLNKHVRRKHENSGRRYTCKECGNVYKCKSSIAKHKCLKDGGGRRTCVADPEKPSPEVVVATVEMVEDDDPQVKVISSTADNDDCDDDSVAMSDGETSSDSDLSLTDLDLDALVDTPDGASTGGFVPEMPDTEIL